MSSRTRGRRAAAAPAEPIAESSSRARGRGAKRAKVEPEAEPELEENVEAGIVGGLVLGEAEEDPLTSELEDAEEEHPISTLARSRARGRGRNRGGARLSAAQSRGRGKAKVQEPLEHEDEDEDAEGEEEEQIEPVKSSRRLRKSVSYKEVPIEEQDDAEEVEEDAEGEPEEEEETKPRRRQPPVRLSSQTSNSTPRKRSRPSSAKIPTPLPPTTPAPAEDEDDDDDDDEDRTDTAYKFDKIPGGSGRGGFSVKGAAAAAARARWDKVRREKIERGEDPDEPRSSSARRPKRRREPLVPDADHVEMGSTMTIKGVEYTVGDDEVVLEEDEKGNTKVDAEGRLLGGREYKLVTFTSATRRNPEKLYAMTIDAARACGYTDSLAFLRRCPQILKLSCTAEERQLLIDIGRIAGNLKHRQVTMVSVRNVFKLMGARIVKEGKWVNDDYYEAESLEKCKEKGWEPGTLAEDDEIPQQQTQSNSLRDLGLNDSTTNAGGRYTYSLAPFYTIGGLTTSFGGTGVDPFTEAGLGNKRQKLKSGGVTEENWMHITAKEASKVNNQLKIYRDERIKALEGDDTKHWVYHLESKTEQPDASMEEIVDKIGSEERGDLLNAPSMDRKRSGLSQDVTREFAQQLEDEEPHEKGDGDVEMDTIANENEDVDAGGVEARKDGPEIVLQAHDEVDSKHNWGLGTWSKGIVKAAYEPHTQTPHIPLWTQPTSSTFDRVSYHPIISSSSTSTNDHVQSILSGSSARGIASLEYAFERSDTTQEVHDRIRQVREAEEWERQSRRRQRVGTVV
ncbi:uncharacterized protein I303_104637 [Kwoniella dejecticola CBS 10117]|uniref:Chromatin structure-remodeling complex protein RSC7 n=1 Tax=Kwoniella dejecticola CBS 10117 TaxID=1296121 RepID=A0A1A6A4R7_9TREE|nr:uncharacterized protein I303_04383 [Kwoniella dejecticola CBS 10117]OBR85055.1 hypothetical protein I303_04383 [Kwoniella dejecticola CBS 10117]